MSGGIAYIYDPDNTLYERINSALVEYTEVSSKHDKEILKDLITKHYKYTNSKKAEFLLNDFDESVKYFKKIVPTTYQKMIDLIAHFESQGLSEEEAKVEAFNTAMKKGA